MNFRFFFKPSRCRYIIAYAAAMELLRDECLCFLARDKVNELLSIFHVFCVLDDVDAIWFRDDAFLHVDELDRCAIGNVLRTALFKGAAHDVLAIRYALINSRRTGEQFAIEILAEFRDVIPAIVWVAITHCIKHIDEVFVG